MMRRIGEVMFVVGMVACGVVDPVPDPVATVTVTPATPSVVVGQTVQLTAVTKDASGNTLTGRTVTWSSSSASATVSSTGLVTGSSAGTATITATSEGKTATSTVTVTAQVPPKGGLFEITIDSIEISGPGQGRLEISIADTTKPTITATGPFTASIEVSGFNSKRSVLVVDASAPGTGFVKLANDRSQDSVKVVATALAFKQLAVTYGFACGLAQDDRAWCWGANGNEQIGAQTTPPCSGGGCQYGNGGEALMPLPVAGNNKFATINVAGKSCTGSFLIAGCGGACAITAAGDTYCWGAFALNSFTPVRRGPDRKMSSMSMGLGPGDYFSMQMNSCGLDNQGAAFCLTSTGSGTVAAAMTFSSFATSYTHTCGISTGDVHCWGSNTEGELGLGTTDTQQHTTPAKVVAPVKFTSVAAGTVQTCALGTDKRIYCWGRGSGTATALPGGSTYESFSMASSVGAACGLTAAGAVECWPSFGTSQSSSVQSPVALSSIGVGGFRSIASGTSDMALSCGLSAAGDAYCWKSDFIAKKLGSP